MYFAYIKTIWCYPLVISRKATLIRSRKIEFCKCQNSLRISFHGNDKFHPVQVRLQNIDNTGWQVYKQVINN